MAKLTDTQLILLTAAAQRQNLSLLPLPTSIGDQGDRSRKAVAALLKHGLARETETANIDTTWREDGDLRMGVFITDLGQAEIGIPPTSDENTDEPPAPLPADLADDAAATMMSVKPTTPKAGSKAGDHCRPDEAGVRCQPGRPAAGDRLAAAYHSGRADRIAEARPSHR